MTAPPHRSRSVIAASRRWREDWTRNPCDHDDREHCGTGKPVRVAQAAAPTMNRFDPVGATPGESGVFDAGIRALRPEGDEFELQRCARARSTACAIPATRSPIPDGGIGATTALAG
jgi:hypothetical protein